MSSGVPSETAKIQKEANMSTSSSTTGAASYDIQSTPKEAPGVELSSSQKVLVGSVLDVSAAGFLWQLAHHHQDSALANGSL